MTKPEPIGKKSLGQHWLKDKASLESICQAVEVKAGDNILEIGPGTGELTKVLTSLDAKVIALEFDESLVEPLQQKFAGTSTQIVQGDIRTFDLTKLPAGYKIVANIPYYLTAYLLRLLTETSNQPTAASILVQKEVAERVASQPGQMSFISVAAQLYYEVELGPVIKTEMFTPPPKVDSQVLVLNKLDQPRFKDVDYERLLKFVKAGFAQPRKTLTNNLSSLLIVDRSIIETWLAEIDLKITVRAQELSLETWHNLFIICARSDLTHAGINA